MTTDILNYKNVLEYSIVLLRKNKIANNEKMLKLLHTYKFSLKTEFSGY